MVLGRLNLPPTVARRFLSLLRPYSTNSTPTGSSLQQHDIGPKPPPREAIEAEWKQLLNDLSVNHALQQNDESRSLSLEPQQPWLLKLTGTSSNLQPSDFYRLAPQSDHVHYWTTQGSLTAVAQARHPTTQEGVDYYQLYFESQAGALRYRDEAIRLHELSKKLGALLTHPSLPRKEQRKKAKAAMKQALRKLRENLAALPDQTKEDKGCQEDEDGTQTQLNTPISSGQQTASPPPWGTLKQRLEPPQPVPRHRDLAAETRGFTLAPPDRELDLQGPYQPGPEDKSPCITRAAQVLLIISGGRNSGFSRSTLGRLIAADGERRNLRWRLRGGASVLPLRVDMSPAARAARKETGVDTSGDMLRQAVELTQAVEASNEIDNDTPYLRYVLSFEDGPEAKRFAREWHTRRLVFNQGVNVFFIKATSLW